MTLGLYSQRARGCTTVLAVVTAVGIALASPALAVSQPKPPPVHGSGSAGYYRVESSNLAKAGGAHPREAHGGQPDYEYLVYWTYSCAPQDQDRGACVKGRVDPCPAEYAGQPGDWRDSDIYVHKIGTAGHGVWVATHCLNYLYIHPAPNPTAVWAQVRKRLPAVRWEPQPPVGKDALVNYPVIFAVDVPQQQPAVPDFRLLNQTIEVTVKVSSYEWQFGDGAADSFDWPGRVHVLGDVCDRESCEGYISHLYAAVGTFRARPTLHWTVTFSADGGPAQPIIPGNLFTQGPSQPIHIVESHGVLVDGGG